MNKAFWKNKRVAVTGANGFIGSRAILALKKAGAVVRAVTSRNKYTPHIKKYCEVFPVDLCNEKQAQAAVHNQEVVLHFAALDGGREFKLTHELDVLQTNMRITETILHGAKKEGVSKLFLMSSIDVYPSTRSGVIEETYGSTNWFYETLTGYAWSKRFMEILSKYYYDTSLGIAIARVGNVYGANDDLKRGRVIPTFIQAALDGKDIMITTSKQQKVPFIHVDDLIPRIMKLIEVYSTCDPVNIVGDDSISLFDLATCIVRQSNSSSQVIYAPKKTTRFRYNISRRKARRILGDFPSRSIEEGIRGILEDMKRDK